MMSVSTPLSTIDYEHHPCFNAKVKGQYGRVHLPVAPKCNVQCNFCNRKYDCVNESRPGVTSTVLPPQQAVAYMEQVLEKEPRITVAGIAGPGDPFANAEETLLTMRLLRQRFPNLILCLATNGLGLKPEHVAEIAEIGVSHVTVTVNAVDPEIGRYIYRWFRDGTTLYQGLKGARVLLDRQLTAIQGLKAAGVVVKVNTVVIPGVNDHHVVTIAHRMAELGVDLHNCMPMYPTPDTPFAVIAEPTPADMVKLRRETGRILPQMMHCTRCRADAVGLLGQDRSEEFRGCLTACATDQKPTLDRPYVAVASFEGVLVNQHLGDAALLQIWRLTLDGFQMLEERPTPEPGSGAQRWQQLAAMLQDCRAVLVSGIGDRPREILAAAGVEPVEMNGFIEAGLQTLYHGGNVQALKGRRAPDKACKGTGQGCG
jgi:nitrogen fixation protein NifB